MSSRAGLLYGILLTGLSPWSKTCMSKACVTFPICSDCSCKN